MGLLPRLGRKRAQKTGAEPGTLIHIGERKTDQVTIQVMAYDGQTLAEKTGQSVEDCREWKTNWVDRGRGVVWINMDGLHDVECVRAMGELMSRELSALSALEAVADVRGIGLMWGIELTGASAAVVARALDAGLLVTSAGERVVRLLPPLVIDEASVREGIATLREVLQ